MFQTGSGTSSNMNANEVIATVASRRLGIEPVRAALPRLAELPLGGTAVGTGINTPPGFPQRVIALLAEQTHLPFIEEAAAKIAKYAVERGTTIREAVEPLGYLECGELTDEQLATALNADAMTAPPRA